MAVLILDAEAVSALARPRENTQRHERVRAAMRSAQVATTGARIARIAGHLLAGGHPTVPILEI